MQRLSCSHEFVCIHNELIHSILQNSPKCSLKRPVSQSETGRFAVRFGPNRKPICFDMKSRLKSIIN